MLTDFAVESDWQREVKEYIVVNGETQYHSKEAEICQRLLRICLIEIAVAGEPMIEPVCPRLWVECLQLTRTRQPTPS
jgi:hypothetical protein